ncbi:unnamed protein product [Macrosiphum euphorbiae]|uniref:Uncharacterized protein n=1 Tax=Macrosiphum euphorbiae TaxID=13131 RepID=A0AAV0X2X3_9HEMI|nr:unnamed protein product [Macrosiphum euphorbiae]
MLKPNLCTGPETAELTWEDSTLVHLVEGSVHQRFLRLHRRCGKAASAAVDDGMVAHRFPLLDFGLLYLLLEFDEMP